MSDPPTTPLLERRLGLFPASNLVIANMIGAGIFTTSGLLLQELGDPRLMLLLWLAGGVLALCGALCYGALGAVHLRGIELGSLVQHALTRFCREERDADRLSAGHRPRGPGGTLMIR